MAPAAAASSILSAAASNKRPAASDAGPIDSGTVLHQQQHLECPRCQSTNTKFCYYNNYSTAQPRHFCRACRRYWTHGGTLRDVPVGGASRRSGKRRRTISAAADAEPSPTRTTARARAEDACLPLPDLSAFPFLTDGSFLPHLDLGACAAPAAFSSWQSSVVPDFYDGLAPWDDGTVGAAAVSGEWSDIAALELSWPPPGMN